jgi:thymidylate synthase (FAD)
MHVKLVSKTNIDPTYLAELITRCEEEDPNDKFIQNIQSAEGLMAYVARVSSSKQDSPTYAGLIKYCMSHGHWSVLETANACFEIETSRVISAQMLRHRSFSFQEFSQRYAAVDESGIQLFAARRQDLKNRQNSIDDLSEEIKNEWEQRQMANWRSSFEHYMWALQNGIAKECARAVLPLQTTTKIYMNGTIRSWVHYLNTRTEASTQLEHREVADAIRVQFVKNFPVVAEAAGFLEKK